jgi:replication factor C small subunit
MKTSTYLWAEKYRPDSLQGYIGNEQMKAKFAHYIETKDIPHLLLTGPAGTGKTTAGKILLNSIPSDALTINASDENNIDTVRNKIRGFASTHGFQDMKILLLDEFDGFTQQGQGALRNLMEEYSHSTRFILTANYIEKIIAPIISRTQQFHIIPPSLKDVAKHVVGILNTEGIEFSLSDLKLIVDAHYPDIRKIINETQLAVRDNKLTVNVQNIIESDFKLKIVDILAGNDKDKFGKIRKLIADNHIRDFDSLYRLLYDRILEYGSVNVPQAIVAINEGQFKDAFVVDKELNFCATLINILDAIK